MIFQSVFLLKKNENRAFLGNSKIFVSFESLILECSSSIYFDFEQPEPKKSNLPKYAYRFSKRRGFPKFFLGTYPEKFALSWFPLKLQNFVPESIPRKTSVYPGIRKRHLFSVCYFLVAKRNFCRVFLRKSHEFLINLVFWRYLLIWSFLS